jgi:hypothetical protein
VRKWWIDRSHHWFKLARPSRIDSLTWKHMTTDLRRKYGFVTLAIFFSLQLDWDGIDLRIWLGWIGINIYFNADDPFNFFARCSAITLLWGRVNPIQDGGQYARHVEDHRFVHCEIPMRQVSIAGQFYLTDKNGQIQS